MSERKFSLPKKIAFAPNKAPLHAMAFVARLSDIQAALRDGSMTKKSRHKLEAERDWAEGVRVEVINKTITPQEAWQRWQERDAKPGKK